MASPLPTARLGSTDVEVTRFGLGTAPLAGMFSPVDAAAAHGTIRSALAGGIRHFDTAPWYGFGLAERRIGDALRDEEGAWTLSTKVGRLLVPARHRSGDWPAWPSKLPFAPVHDYGYEGVRRSFEDSLQRLGLRRIDVLFLHDIGEMTHGEDHPRHFQEAMSGGLEALQELRAEGRIGALGIGVNEVEVLERALELAPWDVFLLAGRYTLLEQRAALGTLLPACERASTSVIVGGAFNSGLLAGGGTWNYRDAPLALIERRDRLAEICRAHGVALEAAALQFPLAHPAVASVLMGCRSPEEVRENLAHGVAPIPGALWEELRREGLLDEGASVPG